MTPKEIIASDEQVRELLMRANGNEAERTCLMCNKPFLSTHAGNRICPKCTMKADRNHNTHVYKTNMKR